LTTALSAVPAPNEPDTRANDSSVLGRAGLVMNAFRERGSTLSLADLTELSTLPKSTVHRLADQLIELGWLERCQMGYRLGLRVFELGSLVERRRCLSAAAVPHLQELVTRYRLSAHLGIIDADEVLVLDVLPARGTRLHVQQGSRQPLHCTALGKALLAHAPRPVVERVVGSALKPLTGYTITSAAVLRSQLDDVIDRGVAFDREETALGVGCLGAPLRGAGRAIGAISVSGDVDQCGSPPVVHTVRTTARAIWHEMFGGSRREVS